MTEHRPTEQPPDEARAELQWVNHLLDADPHNAVLWFRKAFCFERAMVHTIPKRIRLDRVLLWYRQCLREDPGDGVAHYNAGAVLRQLHRHVEALEHAKSAIDIAPENSLAHKLLIMTLQRLGRHREAKAAFRAASEHGCDLDPSIISGTDVLEGRGAEATSMPDVPDAPDAQASYQNPDRVLAQTLQGVVPVVFEFADPELFALQFDLDELTNLDLRRAAEDLCITFELTHGPTSLTQSHLTQLRLLPDRRSPTDGVKEEVGTSAAHPLLEIATRHLWFEYRDIVDRLFAAGAARRPITARDVNEFDQLTRWCLAQLGERPLSLNDLRSAFEAIPGDVLRVLNMATLNFLVARRLDAPLLIAYAATTLAEFYQRLEGSQLPYILYRVAAVSAEQADHADYAANAHGRCALILLRDDRVGAAIGHLEAALKYEDRVVPPNRFGLYDTLARCYSRLSDHKRARECYAKAAAIEGIPESLRKRASYAITGMEVFAQGGLSRTGVPLVLLDGLTLHPHQFDTPDGELEIEATSQHELYDSLLQFADDLLRVRQSLQEREQGRSYLQGYSEVLDVLVRVALELGLPAHALMHLEAQKCIILHNRLRYLLRKRPADLPEPLWDDLQRLIAIHRRMVERPDKTETGLAVASDATFLDVADAVAVKLWECSQVSAASARQLRQRLAFGRFPSKIECDDPAHTLILEFFPGVCFLIRPGDPGNPIAIELPDATAAAANRLVEDLTGIVEEWVKQCSQARVEATPPPSGRFDEFLVRLDEAFYRPIAAPLEQAEAEGVERVCVIPHRALHVLPLNLLGHSTIRESLGDRFDLSFAPSLTSLENLGGRANTRLERFLIVSNPIPRCPAAVCRNPDHDCLSMDGAAREATALAARIQAEGYDVVDLQGENATMKRMADGLQTADVVHLGTHGLFDPDQPEASGVLLAMPDDGISRTGRSLLHNHKTTAGLAPAAVAEILTLDHLWKTVDMFQCTLVNVSACSSGMSDWAERSDEFYGLANGFLYAGAQNVLTNLWPVHDAASETFNSHYYNELLAPGGTPSKALGSAIRRLQASAPQKRPPFAHPLFWAGYRVIGGLRVVEGGQVAGDRLGH